MNVYEWLESPDVREYLEGIHYEFTLPEASWRRRSRRGKNCLTLCRTVLFR